MTMSNLKDFMKKFNLKADTMSKKDLHKSL